MIRTLWLKMFVGDGECDCRCRVGIRWCTLCSETLAVVGLVLNKIVSVVLKATLGTPQWQ